MTTALNTLITHRYGLVGPSRAICVDALGNPSSCRWKSNRRRGANGPLIQHFAHLADLIDRVYSADLLVHAEATSVRDHVLTELAFDEALGDPVSEFRRGRQFALREIAQILNVDGVKL